MHTTFRERNFEMLDHTHQADAVSWVESANSPTTHFPPQCLPYAIFQADGLPQVGVGIGDQVISLAALAQADLLTPAATVAVLDHCDLTGVMSLSLAERGQLRSTLFELVTQPESPLGSRAELQAAAIFDQSQVRWLKPLEVGDYTDFYASVYHATNVGSMFRPDNPLLPNWKHLPIGYHGRASSLVISGTEIRRPNGQLPPVGEATAPTFGPCRQLDYELEVGVYVAMGNPMGSPIPLNEADSHLFGITLVNDWSARDMQRWEYQPLGPFLAKSFATSISPWVLPMEALRPFRVPVRPRDAGDPTPLAYLSDHDHDAHGGIDLKLEVQIQTLKMRTEGLSPVRLSSGNYRDMYWTFAQMLTHHSSNGCNLQPGDLLASGTVSGPRRESRGCLLELTWDGEYGKPVPGSQRTPLRMPSGEERLFLEDGDEIILQGRCEREGFRTIHLGECRGRIIGVPS